MALAVGLAACLLGLVGAVNDYPIIGIFAQPDTDTEDYIVASYVKWVESAGGRVVPIPYHIPNAYAEGNFSVLDGLLFPGGSSGPSSEATYFYNYAVQKNLAGDYFPIWGTCGGFQWLLEMQGKATLDGGYDSENISLPLNFTSAAATSRMLADAGGLYNILATEPVTMNNHQYGLTPTHFNNNAALTSFFSLLSTNNDRQGHPFISMIEAYKVPVYGSQWHPEKNQFEFGEANGAPYEAINHDWHAIQVGQYFANFFVNEARKSTHKYPNQNAEQAALIYNYPVTKTGPEYVETYYFNF